MLLLEHTLLEIVVLDRLNTEVSVSKAALFFFGALKTQFVLHLQLDDPGVRKDKLDGEATRRINLEERCDEALIL